MQQALFQIYNASAGSGKTFTLTKSYLKVLLKSSHTDAFKNILAITFTNKAVGEMKERIISSLIDFSSPSILNDSHDMFGALCEELSITPIDLHKRSKIILKTILHNYASFNISTIDGFTHRVIRTFAHDLKLSMNFEVELDQERMVSEAVDKLISKAGIDKPLTKVLVDFAIEKADDDKSWDITGDFNKIAKLLLSENDLPYAKSLKNKSMAEFKNLKLLLEQQVSELEAQIIQQSSMVLNYIEECGLCFKDFSRSSLPTHFENLSKKKWDVKFDSAWQITLTENNTLYPKRVEDHVASTIDAIQPKLIEAFVKTKNLFFDLKLNQAIIKHITPLSVLNAVQSELSVLKDEQNKLMISEFNSIIHNQIKNQPTPFIYERLGEKFRHYFIDEFQDTSKLQWANLKPLIDNSLSSNNGSLMIVGDAKQAIYRWRGGDADQFINLYKELNNPFVIKPELNTLDKNYRSFKEIISFNNSFFNYISNSCFSKDTYKDLYANANQNNAKTDEGYVNINFLDIANAEEAIEIYPETVLDKIEFCLSQGFERKDICVLVRKRKQAVAVAKHLNNNGLSISSSETLLLINSEKVLFLVNFINLLIEPKNETKKVKFLSFVANWFEIEDVHQFISKGLKLSLKKIFETLTEFNVKVTKKELLQLSLYDLAETIIREFALIDKSDSYLQYFLDEILNFSNNHQQDLVAFLKYFDENKNKLSIVTPQGLDAIKIMTIHQSKGLEFPVVIFPFADSGIYDDREPKVWFPIDQGTNYGFEHGLISVNKDLQQFGEIGNELYISYRSNLELDSVNILYVALTRAIQQLYIITKKDFNSDGKLNSDSYASYLISYLMDKGIWTDQKTEYTFGKPKRVKPDKESNKTENITQKFISQSKESHQLKIISNKGLLWDTEQGQALERGNLVHLILAEIKTESDIPFAFANFINSGDISQDQSEDLMSLISSTITHPLLKAYYESSMNVMNEVEIIDEFGQLFRLDRLVITPNGEAIIIDYKTGTEKQKDKSQILQYSSLLQNMGYSIKESLLVYINDTIEVVKV